jgi:AraC-like DNA-binding protein
VCNTFVHLDCEPQCEGPFFGEISSDVAGDIQVVTVTSTAQLVVRSQRQIARDPADMFLINVQLSGQSMVSQDGRDAMLRPGDFVLYDSTRPYRLSFDNDFAQAVLQIPRSALLPRLGAAECFTASRIDATVGIGRLLSPMLRELPSSLAPIPAAARGRIADNALDLIATALISHHEPLPVAAQKTLVRVKMWIETHLNEDLSAERIAAESRLSIRHLNRLFAREETSLMHYVWQRRLTHCRRALTDPTRRHQSITDIAFSTGFNDLSHFSRAYSAHYGCTPRDTRAQYAVALSSPLAKIDMSPNPLPRPAGQARDP